jgi:hypothetical protein
LLNSRGTAGVLTTLLMLSVVAHNLDMR